MMVARYDGLADWYDEEFQPAPLEGDAWQVVKPLIGEGPGKLLDLGCGTGAYAAALAELGWTVTGVDVSDDMLRRAREREVSVVRSDATGLPFEDASFDAAVSIFTHSDFDDFPAAVCEVARVLKDGAPFVYVGVHPCFVGPHSLYVQAIGVPQLHEGWYRREGHYMEAPGISQRGFVRASGPRISRSDASCSRSSTRASASSTSRSRRSATTRTCWRSGSAR